MPGVEPAVVKWPVGFHAARTLTPQAAREKVQAAVRRAVEHRAEHRPLVLRAPLDVELRFKNYRPAEVLSWMPGVVRADAHSVRFHARDMVEPRASWPSLSTTSRPSGAVTRRAAPDPGPGIRQGRLLLLPVVHYRMEFAALVRQVILERRPAAVAVELPQTLEDAFLKAVARLPRLSVVLYPNKTERVYLPVEVTDPVVEALRTAAEVSARPVFVEPDLGAPPSYRQRYPDTYAVTRVGAVAYIAACRDRAPDLEFEDKRRAAGIAQHLRRVLEEETGEVIAVIGLPLVEGVLEGLRGAHGPAVPFSVPRRESVSLLHLHPDSVAEVLTEMPFLQAVYERCRQGPPPEPPAVAHRVTRDYGPFRVVGGAGEEERSVAAAVDRVARHVCAAQGEGAAAAAVAIDRQRVLLHLFAEAERRYRETTGERLHAWQRRAFGRYTRNLALATGQLMADLFDMTVAARGVADDNLGYELWSWAPATRSSRPTPRSRPPSSPANRSGTACAPSACAAGCTGPRCDCARAGSRAGSARSGPASGWRPSTARGCAPTRPRTSSSRGTATI